MTIRDDMARLIPGLRRFARALVSAEPEERRESADRLAQEAIVRALRSDWSGRGADLRIWLYGTVASLNRERLRDAAARARQSGETELAGAQRGATPANEAAKAFEALDCDEREALALIAIEGLDYGEACEALKIARPMLIARLARARRALSDRIENSHEIRPGRQAPYLRLVK